MIERFRAMTGRMLRQSLALASIGGFASLALSPANALDTRTMEIEMTIGGKPFAVTAEPLSNWQVSSEGQVSLDQKFDIQPGGTYGVIQVKLAPDPAIVQSEPNPCTVLQGMAQGLQREGLRLSPGRTPKANLAPVCSMIAESTLSTQFFYAAMFKSGDMIVAGVARNSRDLTDTEINEFQRYLTSIKAQPRETSQ